MKNKGSNDSGKHLIFNASVPKCDTILLEDVKFGLKNIKYIVNISKMNIIGDIASYKFPETNNVKSGYSINAMLKESHITIHTWPESKSFTFDIYSCKDFDVDLILNFMKEKFNISILNGIVLKRFLNKEFKTKSISFNIKDKKGL